MTFPRSIWTLWLQGWDDAPPIVRACRASWTHKNPGWTLRPLTADNLSDWGDAFPARPPTMPVAAYSDVIRTGILADLGGVWVDATVYCMWPLDWWLPAAAANGFFAFRLGSDRPLATWLLAADRGHPLATAWAARARSYWAGRDHFDRYFWLHKEFANCCRDDPALASAWVDVPNLPAAGAHAFWPADQTLTRPLVGQLRERVLSRLDPVYKLSHRVPAHFPAGSAGEFFLQTADQAVDSL